jgi:hypothetical protein
MLGRNVKSATLCAPLYGGTTRMTTGQNPLAGVPLRCLIGGDGAGEGKDGELIMAPYDATVAPRRGYSAKYLNFYREDGEPPAYGPYLPRTTTARDYHEGVPDPGGAGFWRNLDEQLLWRNAAGLLLSRPTIATPTPTASSCGHSTVPQARASRCSAKIPARASTTRTRRRCWRTRMCSAPSSKRAT